MRNCFISLGNQTTDTLHKQLADVQEALTKLSMQVQKMKESLQAVSGRTILASIIHPTKAAQ